MGGFSLRVRCLAGGGSRGGNKPARPERRCGRGRSSRSTPRQSRPSREIAVVACASDQSARFRISIRSPRNLHAFLRLLVEELRRVLTQAVAELADFFRGGPPFPQKTLELG